MPSAPLGAASPVPLLERETVARPPSEALDRATTRNDALLARRNKTYAISVIPNSATSNSTATTSGDLVVGFNGRSSFAPTFVPA